MAVRQLPFVVVIFALVGIFAATPNTARADELIQTFYQQIDKITFVVHVYALQDDKEGNKIRFDIAFSLPASDGPRSSPKVVQSLLSKDAPASGYIRFGGLEGQYFNLESGGPFSAADAAGPLVFMMPDKALAMIDGIERNPTKAYPDHYTHWYLSATPPKEVGTSPHLLSPSCPRVFTP